MEARITQYQKQCWKTYKQEVGISANYTYLYGNPVKVHVPMDTACCGVMIMNIIILLVHILVF